MPDTPDTPESPGSSDSSPSPDPSNSNGPSGRDGRHRRYRCRPYDPETDREALWSLKRAFELGLGSGTGDDEKARTYENKLTDEYRTRYLEWVDRCLDESSLESAGADTPSDAAVVTVAEATDGHERHDGLVGYVFVLPESFGFVWDAAVLNELFVAEPFRGTGVADDLLEAAIAVAGEQDLPLERLVLDVDPDNERARAFYRRHGFESWGEMVARPL